MNTKKENPLLSLIACAGIASIAALALRDDIEVSIYNLDTGKNEKITRLLLLTDLHSSKYGSGQHELIARIDELAPDAVLLGGDICDDEVPHERTWQLLQVIGSKYPCYFVSGNHEYWTGELTAIKEKMSEYGVAVLDNTKSVLETDNGKINIYGINDPQQYGYYDIGKGWTNQLETLDREVDRKELNVLLSHRPEGAPYYRETKFDAVLCGHAHGGQVRLPKFLRCGVYAPNQGPLPKFTCGLYMLDKVRMVVSRGLCRDIRPRIFNRPEIVVVDIR